jgi:hypothetical protein
MVFTIAVMPGNASQSNFKILQREISYALYPQLNALI